MSEEVGLLSCRLENKVREVLIPVVREFAFTVLEQIQDLYVTGAVYGLLRK